MSSSHQVIFPSRPNNKRRKWTFIRPCMQLGGSPEHPKQAHYIHQRNTPLRPTRNGSVVPFLTGSFLPPPLSLSKKKEASFLPLALACFALTTNNLR